MSDRPNRPLGRAIAKASAILLASVLGALLLSAAGASGLSPGVEAPRSPAPPTPTSSRSTSPAFPGRDIKAPLPAVAAKTARALVDGVGLPELSIDDLGPRVLVVAPHPDDETIAAGGLIRSLVTARRKVSVVIDTCGDGFAIGAAACLGPRGYTPTGLRKYGAMRAAESLAAAKALGLRPGDVTFLGFPDGGGASEMSTQWNDGDPHRGRNGTRACPYPFALDPGGAYSGAQYARELEQVLERTDPTTVVYPDMNDLNSEHWSTGAFVQYALMASDRHPIELTYVVHRDDYPRPLAFKPSDQLLPPYELTSTGAQWHAFVLTSAQTRVVRSAIDSYRTQSVVGNEGSFLQAFDRANEVFATYRTPVMSRQAEPPVMSAGADLPFAVILHPANSVPIRRLRAYGGIARVAMARDKDSFVLGLQLRAPLKPSVTYAFDLRVRTAAGVLRYRVGVGDDGARGTVRGDDGADTAVAVRGPMPVGRTTDRVWVTLPVSVLAGATQALLEAETWWHGKLIDRAGYQRIAIAR